MSRTNRFLKGFGVSYLSLFVTTVAGFFLTRLYLHHLGQVNYGYWLVVSQLLGFAMLLDLGVVALLPREVAYVTGATGGKDCSPELSSLAERVSGLVIVQMPFVVALLFLGWLLLPTEWAPLRGPLALLLVGFTLSFPLRIPTAVLNGLQDLGFLSSVQLIAWCIGTLATVVLVLLGIKLGALAIGYLCSQGITSLWALVRLRRRWPGIRVTRLLWPGREALAYLRSAGWATASQVAQILILGTEGIIIGSLFGAASVVPYSMTGKLFAVLGNQPNLVMQAAAPGLSETRTATDGPTRLRISLALGQGMLTLTASIVIVILAVNRDFVTLWLGSAQYAGLAVTTVFGLRLFLRHWNTTLVYTLFSFGHERRIGAVALADGILTVVFSVLFARRFGIIGVPLGSIVAVLLTSLPLNTVTIQSDTGVSVLRIVAAQLYWQWRVLLLGVFGSVLSLHGSTAQLPALVGKGLLAFFGCVGVFGPLMLRPPLGTYVRPRLDLLLSRLGRSRSPSA